MRMVRGIQLILYIRILIYILFLKANDDSEDTDSHDEEDDETNDRVIPVTQDFYSADDIQMNDETSPTAP